MHVERRMKRYEALSGTLLVGEIEVTVIIDLCPQRLAQAS